SIFQISSQIDQLPLKPPHPKLTSQQIKPPTSTITNIASPPRQSFTPLINHPQLPILPIAPIPQKPIVKHPQILPPPL
ncbi:2-oxo acid dehydrogenase subunit E2, partial [Staphylococcus epidermidis]|uniref:2-oxo acid dehydrogenase subunit E2 n=1 Tax=Staphylococcus epidermidis TaxID=1282 RepID=UPI00119FCB1E